MRFEWDENKARINLANHHLSFAIAQHVFDDPNHLSVQDWHEEGEERWQALGRIAEAARAASPRREIGQAFTRLASGS